MQSLFYVIEMARAFESISRAFGRLRLGRNNSNSPSNSNHDMENESQRTPSTSSTSTRRSEKRKISSAMLNRDSRGSSKSSPCDVTDGDTDTATEGVSKRRRTPADQRIEDVTLGCARSIDDLRAHTLVFRVRRGSAGATDDIDLHRNRSDTGGSRQELELRVRSNTSNECRLSCEMGDVWTQAYYEKPVDRHLQVSTGNEFTDRILPAIQYKGYIPQRHLATGQFSSVLLAAGLNHRESHRFVAVKFLINPSRSQGILHPWQNDTPEEVRMLRKLHHDNIVELIDFWPIHGRQAIAMEYCPHGNIQDLLEQRPSGFLSEVTSRRYFRGMHAAVEYLNLQCIVHRDITTKHFLIDSKDRVKLTDFSCALHFKVGDELRTDRPGNPAYHPPEYSCMRAYNPRGADVWALGLVLYIMVTGRMPQDPQDKPGVKWPELAWVPFPDSRVLLLSREVQTLLKGMLLSLVEARLTLNRVGFSDWLQDKSSKVSIGSYHLVREPHKLKAGHKEEQRKMEFDM